MSSKIQIHEGSTLQVVRGSAALDPNELYAIKVRAVRVGDKTVLYPVANFDPATGHLDATRNVLYPIGAYYPQS